jgi:phage terminase small subunit
MIENELKTGNKDITQKPSVEKNIIESSTIENLSIENTNTVETNAQELPTLRPKLQKLIELVLSDENYAKAHEIAGYKAKTTQARYQAVCDYLNDPIVSKYVEIRRKQISDKIQKQTEVTILRTISELARISYADPKNLFNEDGSAKDIAEIDEDTRRAIASVEVEETFIGRGETRTHAGYTKKIKFWNKNDALKTVAQYLGMLIERKEISSTVVYRELEKITDKDLLDVTRIYEERTS